MNLTIRKEFRAHVIKVIDGLKIIPILEQGGIMADAHAPLKLIEFIKSLFLEFISQPCREIAFFIGPRNRIEHMHCRNGLKCGHNFRRGCKLKLSGFQDGARQVFQEIKNTCRFWLQLTESFIINKYINDLFLFGQSGHPAGIFFCSERIFTPGFIPKPEREIVTEPEIAHQNL